jgi:hypothetical protein
MVVALALFGLIALMIPGCLARALACTAGNVSHTTSAEFLLGMPMVALLLLLVFEGLRRKVNPIKKTSFFISCASLRARGLALLCRWRRSTIAFKIARRREPIP